MEKISALFTYMTILQGLGLRQNLGRGDLFKEAQIL